MEFKAQYLGGVAISRWNENDVFVGSFLFNITKEQNKYKY